MREIINTLLVVMGAAVAARTGVWLARRPGKIWMWGALGPLTVLFSGAAALNFRWLAFVAPWSWLTGGWSRWVVISVSASITLGTLITRLPKASTRRALWMLWGLILLRTAAVPFLSPLLSNPELETMTTQVGRDGVCLQSTPYNCGPASAVTALRKLGFAAEEGQLGLLCQTTCVIGTPDDLLEEGLRKDYGPQGLVLERRYVPSVEELKAWPVSIAVIHYNIFVDHYVTVMGFKGDKILVGDPLSGLNEMPVAEFSEGMDACGHFDEEEIACLVSRRRDGATASRSTNLSGLPRVETRGYSWSAPSGH